MSSPSGPGAAFVDDALAVIVLYGRALEATATYESASAAIRATGSRLALLAFDNSPRPAALPDDVAASWDIHAASDPSNPGVSAAYLAGAELAGRLGKRWLLFFDQDTWLPADAFEAYARAARDLPDEVLLAPVLRSSAGVVSPCAYRFPRGRSLGGVVPGRRDLEGVSVLNSGMCVRRDAYEAVGGHDPRIPLDFSDHEFVGRLAAAHPTFAVIDATFRHGFSGHEAHTVAQRAARFDAYCRGAIHAAPRPFGRVAAAAVIVARAAMLALRWRSPRFLAVPLRAARRHV